MSSRSPKRDLYVQFAAVAKAIANEHRLELLELVAQGERSVEALDEVERIWSPIRDAVRAQGERGRQLGETGSRAGVLAAQQGGIARRLAAAALREASETRDEARAAAARERQRLEAEMRRLRDDLSSLTASLEPSRGGGEDLDRHAATVARGSDIDKGA